MIDALATLQLLSCLSWPGSLKSPLLQNSSLPTVSGSCICTPHHIVFHADLCLLLRAWKSLSDTLTVGCQFWLFWASIRDVLIVDEPARPTDCRHLVLWFSNYTVSQKRDTILLSISLLNIDRLLQFFHRRTQLKLCNKIINKDPTLPQMCCYTTLWYGQEYSVSFFWLTVYIYIFRMSTKCWQYSLMTYWSSVTEWEWFNVSINTV